MFKGLYLNGSGYAETTNPNITGDLTVVAELWKERWSTDSNQALVSVYNTLANQRSWIFRIDNNDLLDFVWSTDGIAPLSTDGIQIPSKYRTNDFSRFKVEVNVDPINPGTVTFYAFDFDPAVNAYVQLSQEVIAANTSFFSSTADLVVGAISTTSPIPSDTIDNAVIKKVEVYNGININLVVDARFDLEVRGTTSFTDNTTNIWTLNPSASIIDGQTPNIGLWLPDVKDVANEWAKDLTQELNELNAEAIDTFVTTGAFQTVDNVVINDTVNGGPYTHDGTAKVHWREIGDLVVMNIDIFFGANNTAKNAGFVQLILPVACDVVFHDTQAGSALGDIVGEAHLYDSSPEANRQNGVVFLASSDKVQIALMEGTSTILGGTVPFTPASGDSWNLSLVYKKV